MTAVLSRVDDEPSALWGFCPTCELWRFSTQWIGTGSNAAASCPVCGSGPSALEVLEGGVARVHLMLELPPGGDIPFLT